MKYFLSLALLLCPILFERAAPCKTQVVITGRSAEEVQEQAFKKKMSYTLSPLKCDQRCSQLWERD